MIATRQIAIITASLFVMGMLFVPTSSAQVPQTTFTFSISGNPNAPVAPLVTQSYKIEYTFGVGTGVQNLAGLEGAVTINFQTTCDPGVIVSGPETDNIVINPAPGATGFTVTRDLSYQLSVDRDVRALDQLKCTVNGDVTTPNTQTLPPPPDVSRNFLVQADYFSLIEAKTDLKLKQGGPQKQIPFNLEITNFGNGQTKINFETTEDPGGKWQGLAPDVLLLDEKGGTREASTVTFTVVTPFKNGWNNEEGAFTILLKPEYSFDNKKTGSEVAVTLVARVRGVYVPSLEPLVMVGAVIGSALVARMMKDEE